MRFRRGLLMVALAAVLVVALVVPVSALHPRYHTHAEIRSELKAVAAAYPAITKRDTLGYSTTNGYAITWM